MRQCLCFVIYKYQLSLKCLSPLQLLLRLWVPGKEKEKEEEEEDDDEEEQKHSCKGDQWRTNVHPCSSKLLMPGSL